MLFYFLEPIHALIDWIFHLTNTMTSFSRSYFMLSKKQVRLVLNEDTSHSMLSPKLLLEFI